MHNPPDMPSATAAGKACPNLNGEACAAAPRPPEEGRCGHQNTHGGVGADGQVTSAALNRRCRIERVLRDLQAGRTVPDDELLQHREDCRFAMEEAHDRFLIFEDQKDLQESRQWMARRDRAVLLLSAEWKDAREAENLRAAAGGPGGSGCFFTEQGDRARAERAQNEEGRAG